MATAGPRSVCRSFRLFIPRLAIILLAALALVPARAEESPQISGQARPGASALGQAIPGGSAPGDLFRQSDRDALVRNLAGKAGDVVSALDFCATADARAANSTCLQSAVAALCSRAAFRGGGTIYLPAGRYLVDSTVTVPCDGVRLVGAGIGHRDRDQNGTEILCTVTAGACIRFAKPDATNYTYGGGVEHLSFVNASTGGTPVALQVEYAQDFHAQNLYFWAPYQAVKVVGGAHLTFYGLHLEAMLQDGTGLEVTGTYTGGSIDASQATRNDVATFQDVFMTAGGVAPGHRHPTCLHIHDFAATTIVRSLQCVNPHAGVVIDCAAGAIFDACPAFMDFRDLEIDFADTYNLVASDFQSLKCFGCYFHGTTTTLNNVKLYNDHYNGSWSAQFIGGKADGTLGSCIDTQVGATVITGMDIANCNHGNSGSAGIELRGPRPGTGDASGSIVIGANTFCRFGSAVPTAMAGVLIGDDVDYVSVFGNVFSGCSSPALVNNSSGIQVQIGGGNAGP